MHHLPKGYVPIIAIVYLKRTLAVLYFPILVQVCEKGHKLFCKKYT